MEWLSAFLLLLLLLLFEFKEGMAFSLKFELFSWE